MSEIVGIRCEVERVGRKLGGGGGLKVKEVNRKLGSFEKSLEVAGTTFPSAVVSGLGVAHRP